MSYIHKFVTANLANKNEPRQGWVTDVYDSGLFIIKGESGKLYLCEGTPNIVTNPPDAGKFFAAVKPALTGVNNEN